MQNSEIQSDLDDEKDSEMQEASNKYTIELKEVVFSNMLMQDMSLDTVRKNQIRLNYNKSVYEKNGKDSLYAFYVTSHLYGEIIERQPEESIKEYDERAKRIRCEYIVDSALELGLMVLETHPYCAYNSEFLDYPELGNCVVVGTAEQITALFDDTELWKEHERWILMPAARPDYPSILEQVGLKGDIVVGLGSYDQYEDIQTIIGTGETVVLTVPVIVSNDISKIN